MRRFFLRTSKSSGEATLFFQLRSVERHGLNIARVNTGVTVSISKWIAAQADEDARDEYKETPEGKEVYKRLKAIDEAINQLLECSSVTKEDVDEVMSQFVRDAKKKADNRKAKNKQEREDAQKREILNYLAYFISGVKNQTRTSQRNIGRVIGLSSLHCYVTLQKHLTEFLADTPHITFDELTSEIATEFRVFLRAKNLMPQTVNRVISNMRAVVNAAANEKMLSDFSVTRWWGKSGVDESDTKKEIFLTDEEINALCDLQLQNKLESEVRDLFLLGYATGQRFSDYGDITPDDVKEHKGRIILDRRQKKTRSKVVIEVEDPVAIDILKKYGNNFPKIEHTKFNSTIKKLFSRLRFVVPSLGEMVTTTISGKEKTSEEYFARLIEKKNRGEQMTETEQRAYLYDVAKQELFGGTGDKIYRRDVRGRILKPKYMLVGSHTARRSFVTNEINEGNLTRKEIMKITGHKEDKILDMYDLTAAYDEAIRIGDKRREARQRKSAKTIQMNQVN